MTIRILALLPEAATVATCLDMASAAANALPDAEIEALHVSVDPRHIPAPPEEIDFQRLRERREGTAAERATATRAAFDQWLAEHGGTDAAWKQIIGAEEQSIRDEAQQFDVLVLARQHNTDGADAMEAAFYEAGRPFFLAPDKPSGFGRSLVDRVVIAWSDTPQCRRAIAGALPWLRVAKTDVVLLIADGDPAPNVATDLSGLACQQVVIGRDSEKLGDQIVHAAEQLGATLLVLGAHRHNIIIEWLIGHTTDQVLRHQELAVFLSH